MDIILFVILILIQMSVGLESTIWNQKSLTFTPISNITEFKNRYEIAFNVSREKEIHNFHKKKIHLGYFEEPTIFEFYDNNTRATGIAGEVWTILSELLNFTIVLTKVRDTSIGFQPHPNENFSGILGMMQQKMFTVVPRMEAFAPRLNVVQISTPLWKDDLRLFIKPYYQFKATWMIDLFAWKIWTLIFVFYLVLCISSYISQKFTNDPSSYHLMSSIGDNFFYGFGAICNQGDVMFMALKKCRILSFNTSLFSWLLITAFNSQLIIHMTQKVLVRPFSNLDQVLDNTDYTILAIKGSVAHLVFQRNYSQTMATINSRNQTEFFTNLRRMWDLACTEGHKYTVFQSELQRTDNDGCGLYPIGESYLRTWIVAGIAKNFTYKKTIDIGIMKLNEFGIINALKIRWLYYRRDHKPVRRYYSPITLHQISLIIGIYFFGLFSSIVMIIFEKIVYSSKRNSRKRR